MEQAGAGARFAMTVPYLWSGAHEGKPGVAMSPVLRVEISSTTPDIPYQLDGELAGVLPVTIERSERRLVVARL